MTKTERKCAGKQLMHLLSEAGRVEGEVSPEQMRRQSRPKGAWRRH